MVHRTVELMGLAPIMFDRYAGDNQTKLLWWQKIYLIPGSDVLCLPTTNIVSFLSAHNTNSAPKRWRDFRKYKGVANACLSFVQITGEPENPGYIAFRKNDELIRAGDAKDEVDPKSGMYLHKIVARLEKGIPNPKERPVLPLPWSIRFQLSIIPNQEIKEQEIRNLFEEGGLAIGLGTFRGVFGKFEIARWD
jgi:hypothetical protein